MNARILVTEDDTVAGELFAEVLEEQGYSVDRVETGEDALARLRGGAYDLLLVDVQLPGRSGLEVTREARRLHPDLPIVVMTAFGSMESAIEAIREGAFDYASKPMNLDELKQVVARALAQRLQAAAAAAAQAHGDEEIESDGGRGGATEAGAHRGGGRNGARQQPLGSIIGRSPVMVDVYKTVARVAPTRSTVLIFGESGTGKELVARAIHQHSPRAQRPFMAIDCGALPESLLESELFGHVRGAFTGAVADKKGLFEEADGNTCFLDEIGDISQAVQAKLLRVLQEGQVRRIGSQRWTAVDVRVVAATNKDLATLTRAGLFREDLYYRLNVVSIRLPPLRERPEDVPSLAEHFLHRYARQNGKHLSSIGPGAMQTLCAYQWPGNIRELENTIERAVTLSNQRVLTEDDLPADLRDAAARARAAIEEGSSFGASGGGAGGPAGSAPGGAAGTGGVGSGGVGGGAIGPGGGFSGVGAGPGGGGGTGVGSGSGNSGLAAGAAGGMSVSAGAAGAGAAGGPGAGLPASHPGLLSTPGLASRVGPGGGTYANGPTAGLDPSGRPGARPAAPGDTAPGFFTDTPTLEEVKKRYIRHVIASTRGNLSRAAAILDVDRRSLYRMLDRYKIDPPGREE